MRKLLGIRSSKTRPLSTGPSTQNQSQGTVNRPTELDGTEIRTQQTSANVKMFREAAERKANEGAYESAIVLYDQALELVPQDSELLLCRAFAYASCQKLDLALRDANAAIQRMPTDWHPWQAKAGFLAMLGEYDEAEGSYQNAIGFASGMDRVRLQNDLTELRRKKNSSPTSASELPGPHILTPPPPPPPPPPVSEPTEQPPEYTPPPQASPLEAQEINRKLLDVQRLLAMKNKGQVAIRPYTSTLQIDAIQLVYAGLSTFQIPARVNQAPVYLHATHKKIAVSTIEYPGNTYLDVDCETASFYDGEITGTTSVTGYSEEYRNDQLLKAPALKLALEANNGFPVASLDKVVARLKVLQLSPTREDDVGLKEFLGLSALQLLQNGFGTDGSRQKRISSLCMMMTRAQYTDAVRFLDFSKARTLTSRFLVSHDQDSKLRDFLFQIMIGAEIFIRIRLEPRTVSWASIVTDQISALIIAADLFMQNIQITGGPSTTLPVTAGGLTTATLLAPTMYRFVSVWHQRNCDGLIKFAEALQWPLMDEARRCIETAYEDLTAGRSTINWDMCDWMFGLILPGKVFRHRIMSSLVNASPTIRALGGAPFYENGVIVQNKSYWPKRTVLGRVLGGIRNVKSVCGWIGPLAAPTGNVKGWVRLNSRHVDIPVPMRETGNALQSFGFGDTYQESDSNVIQNLLDPNEFIHPTPPAFPVPHRKFNHRSIILDLIPPATNTATLNPALPPEEYRASLEFEMNGAVVRYTLYSNPVFITAPPCVGSHVMFRRQAEMFQRGTIQVADLKQSYPANDTLTIINALGEGDEVVARAWCAERGRHAIIRREGSSCCYTCATNLATTYSGLAVNVVIWSR